MASELQRPVSDYVAQGWEVIGFSSTDTASHVLLRRQRQHKIVVVWKKAFGGVGHKELDV